MTESAINPSSNKVEDTQTATGAVEDSTDNNKEQVKEENPAANDKDEPKDTREDWEVQRDSHKKAGDDAFRAGDCEEAIIQYTNALSVDPANHLILSNRSAANLKQGNKSKALQDARACIDAEPSFVKGHSRLAAALRSLGRYQPAKSAYTKVLELDATNQIAKKGIQDCTEQLRIQEQAELKLMQEELKRKTEEEGKKKKENEEKKIAEEEEKSEKKEDGGGDDEDDLLNDFFSEVETAATKPKSKPKEEETKDDTSSRNNVIRVQKKDLGTAQQQIDRLLAPRYEWRNLNPFLVLDLPHTSSEDDVSKRYKALSLLLHPDKCRSLDHAKEAYDEVQRAKKTLDDEHKGRHARQLVERGMKMGLKEWRANGENEQLEEVQSRATQKIFAEIEYKRREVERREQKQEQRERQQEENELKKEKDDRQFDKKWREDNRVEKRIGNWRDFQKKGSSKKQKL